MHSFTLATALFIGAALAQDDDFGEGPFADGQRAGALMADSQLLTQDFWGNTTEVLNASGEKVGSANLEATWEQS